ncbi:MAG: hypothetical protein K0R49_1460 [Burkholderiales bacterium]|jgi:hypothetical protein|nr:hypothetical protein [Burkholderiales bacterium]
MKKILLMLGAAYYIKAKKPELWEDMKKRVCNFLNINSSEKNN